MDDHYEKLKAMSTNTHWRNTSEFVDVIFSLAFVNSYIVLSRSEQISPLNHFIFSYNHGNHCIKFKKLNVCCFVDTTIMFSF